MPLGLLALAIALRFVPESRSAATTSTDWLGTLWLALGLLGISYALIQGTGSGWNAPSILWSGFIGICALVWFVRSQHAAAHPLLPLHLFKNKTVATTNLMTFFLYFSLNGVYVFQVIYFQQQFGYAPLAAGAGMLVPSLMVTMFAGPAGSITNRTGPRLPLIFGPLLSAAGIALLMLPDAGADYFTHFLPALALLGAGMVIFVAPITKSALAVELRYSGVASGINNSVARISGLFAVAVLGAVMAAAFGDSLAELVSASTFAPRDRHALLLQAGRVGGIEIPPDFDAATAETARSIVQQSLTHAFRWAMGINAAFALASGLLAFWLIEKPTSPALRDASPHAKGGLPVP